MKSGEEARQDPEDGRRLRLGAHVAADERVDGVQTSLVSTTRDLRRICHDDIQTELFAFFRGFRRLTQLAGASAGKDEGKGKRCHAQLASPLRELACHTASHLSSGRDAIHAFIPAN